MPVARTRWGTSRTTVYEERDNEGFPAFGRPHLPERCRAQDDVCRTPQSVVLLTTTVVQEEAAVLAAIRRQLLGWYEKAAHTVYPAFGPPRRQANPAYDRWFYDARFVIAPGENSTAQPGQPQGTPTGSPRPATGAAVPGSKVAGAEKLRQLGVEVYDK